MATLDEHFDDNEMPHGCLNSSTIQADSSK